MPDADIRQAVLLAAGTGTRLLPLTERVPKTMVEVGGKPIVDHLLDALEPLGVRELVVVTGHRAESLVQHLRARGGMAVRAVHNERYATTNNILSLYAARDAIDGAFLLLESDVVATAEVLAPLSQPDTMIVAPYRADMDGTGVRLGPDGAVEEMIVRAHERAADRLASLHKTVNFYSFSAELWRDAYLPALSRWVAAGRLDQYYEAVLAELVDAGEVSLRGADVGHEGWAEIDDRDDLARAETLLERQK